MELFENIYSLWALALVLLCAGNGLFFLSYTTHPNWLWKQTVPAVTPESKNQEKKSQKKNAKKSKASKGSKAVKSKNEENTKKNADQLIGQRSSTGVSSDSDESTGKDAKKTSSNQKSYDVARNSKKTSLKGGSSGHGERDVSPKKKQETETKSSQKPTKPITSSSTKKPTISEDSSKPNAEATKKQKKKKTKKVHVDDASANSASATTHLTGQQSDYDSQEEWNIVSSDGKAKRPPKTVKPAPTTGNSAFRMDKFDVDSRTSKTESRPQQQVASLADVFDLSLAEIKEKEAQYQKMEASSSSLEKIINARIVGIQENNENNGFAASAAVASVHHLQRKLMNDGNHGVEISDSPVQNKANNRFAYMQQQLAYEHQIRTNQIQQEFMKSVPTSNWNQIVFGTSGLRQDTSDTSPAWGEEQTAGTRFNLGQTLQSSFEFVPQRNLPVSDNTVKMISTELDEGSIAFRRHNEFADRAFEDGSRTSDSTEEEYSVIDTVISSEFSRRNNSNASIVDVAEDLVGQHEFAYVDGQDEHLDDIDLIDEFSMVSMSTKPDVKRNNTAAGENSAAINSSLTFHGSGGFQSPRTMVPAQSYPMHSSAEMKQQLDANYYYSASGGNSSPSICCSHQWTPAKLNLASTDQIKNGFATYKANKQFVIMEAMRAMQARHREEPSVVGTSQTIP